MFDILPVCLSASSLRFSNIRKFASLPPHIRAPPFRWFYDVNSAENPSNRLFALLPEMKTDDSKYNYIHFLLLLRPFSRAPANPISSSGHDDVNTYRQKKRGDEKKIPRDFDGLLDRRWWRVARVEKTQMDNIPFPCTGSSIIDAKRNHIVDGITISFLCALLFADAELALCV